MSDLLSVGTASYPPRRRTDPKPGPTNPGPSPGNPTPFPTPRNRATAGVETGRRI